MSKHVVLAVWTLGRGGAERLVVDLARRLPKRGFVPRVVALGGGGPLEEELRSSGIEVMIGPDTPDRRATHAFAQHTLARCSHDTVMHTHLGADQWLGYPARKKGLPWIVTAHNDDHDLSWLKRKMRVFVWNRAHKVACVSQTVQGFWQAQGVRPAVMEVVPNGIDLSRFSPKTSLQYGDDPLIVCVGRLAEQKRQTWLLRALADLDDRPWRLELVGDGPMRADLEALTDELGLRPRVTFRGVLADVRSVYQRADLFALPSAWEGQGLVTLEAAAAGVPMILADRPAFREWLSDDAALFVEDTLPAWTDALARALHDVQEMQARAWKAHEAVVRFGDVERMVDRYVELYTGIVWGEH